MKDMKDRIRSLLVAFTSAAFSVFWLLVIIASLVFMVVSTVPHQMIRILHTEDGYVVQEKRYRGDSWRYSGSYKTIEEARKCKSDLFEYSKPLKSAEMKVVE